MHACNSRKKFSRLYTQSETGRRLCHPPRPRLPSRHCLISSLDRLTALSRLMREGYRRENCWGVAGGWRLRTPSQRSVKREVSGHSRGKSEYILSCRLREKDPPGIVEHNTTRIYRQNTLLVSHYFKNKSNTKPQCEIREHFT